MKKRIISIRVLVSALMLALMVLAGCSGAGGSAAPKVDPNLGLYKISSLNDMSEEEFTALLGESFANEFTLDLKEEGQADFTISGDLQAMTYAIDGDKITLTSENSESIEGTIADGYIKLQIDNGNMEFKKVDPNEAAESADQTESVKETEQKETAKETAAETEKAETEESAQASETRQGSETEQASETEQGSESETEQ